MKLPDLVLALNADDFPRGHSEPWVSFCRQPRLGSRDLLLPNRVEDGLFALSAPATLPLYLEAVFCRTIL